MHARAAYQRKSKTVEKRRLFVCLYLQKLGVSKNALSSWLSQVIYVPNRQTVTAFGAARAAASKRKADTTSISCQN